LSLGKLKRRVADPAPGLECEGVDRVRFIVPVAHELGGPAPEKALAGLARFIDGASPSLLSLYREVSGIRLCVAGRAIDEVVGIEIPPLAGLADQQEAFQAALESDESGDLEDAVVLGGAPGSGNYLVMPRTGGRRGRVLLFDHETGEAERFASDVTELLGVLAGDPVVVMRRIGSVARYGSMLGVPKRYLSDVR